MIHALPVVRSNSELTSGEFIEAYYKATLVHRGEVTDIAADPELFWMMDVLTGNRKLVDIAEVEVVRSIATVHVISGALEPGRAVAGSPS